MATHSPVLIDELFGELAPAPEGQRWEVIHTKPRCEKKLAEYARRNGITYYLPQMDSKRVYQRRVVSFTKPMFPSYLFCVLDSRSRQTLLISGYTVSFIRVHQQEQLLQELRNIKLSRLPEIELQNTIWLSEGLQVEIMQGPLKGVTGVVESHDKLDEVRLQVQILRQAVLVKIDPRNVKILGEYTIVEKER
ncbi:MAG TPA: transcription termination/antitermination NusG family protein [Candidatus Syntrophosphaera sp.]|jgi:transcription antitermination factor NusG|nr:transcription termination/antitermination NusG family protein [Candidatus Cloacimonadota bacterium]HOR03837.1 transcription termination/antitermination NusG family protein [Candidatus Syntrophosphaera sp.]HPB44066.1 transcription termination/antitermination NusG family protein [Candidatus Syntrophosphaera sp.]HPK83745.1 transcription termination/antitermination NusG family protein [Candidatus Syntrophosphaera sp.]HQG94221.1 transcription termination/antitermination NusG family protein [Candi